MTPRRDLNASDAFFLRTTRITRASFRSLLSLCRRSFQRVTIRLSPSGKCFSDSLSLFLALPTFGLAASFEPQGSCHGTTLGSSTGPDLLVTPFFFPARHSRESLSFCPARRHARDLRLCSRAPHFYYVGLPTVSLSSLAIMYCEF